MVVKDAAIPGIISVWCVVIVSFSALVIWEMKTPLVMRYASALLALGVMSFCFSSYFTLYYLCWEEDEIDELLEARSPVDPFPNCGMCVGVNFTALATLILSSLIIADEKTTTYAGERNETYGFAAVVIAGASLIWLASAYQLVKKGVRMYET